MKPSIERQDLLEDILSPEAQQDDQFLLLTLNAVRTRRTARRRQRVGVALLLMLAFISLPLRLARRPGPSDHRLIAKEATNPRHVTTAPLAASRTLSTRPGSTPVIQSAALSSASITRTQKSQALQYINDEQLLLLAEGRGAILVREGNSPLRLLFAHGNQTQ